MQLTKAWQVEDLLTALRPIGIADGIQDVLDFLGVVLGWLAASLTLEIVSNPIYAVLASLIPQLTALITAQIPQIAAGMSAKFGVIPVTLTKPWDTQALINALKTTGWPDIAKNIDDALACVFDWINSSIALNTSPIYSALAPLATYLETLALQEIAAEESKLGVTSTTPVSASVSTPPPASQSSAPSQVSAENVNIQPEKT